MFNEPRATAIVFGKDQHTIDPSAAVGLLVVLVGVFITTRQRSSSVTPSVSAAGIEPDDLDVSVHDG